jgi:hypothetical protein
MIERSATSQQVSTVEVAWVPPAQVGDAIKGFGFYLLRGLKAADMELGMLVDWLVNFQCRLGIAFTTYPFRPLGCWVSDLRETEEGASFATVYALSGERLPAWMPKIEALVIDWARENDCGAVRFFGRAAYTALIEDLRVIGKAEDGRALLFEKTIAAKLH